MTTNEIKKAEKYIKAGHVVIFSSLDEVNREVDLIHVDDAYVYTAGLYALGKPEVVIMLGPRKLDQPIDAENSLGLITDALLRFNKAQLESMTTREVNFVSIGIENRIRYYQKVSFNIRDSDDRHRYFTIKEKYLGKLSKILKTDNFDYVLYQPSNWAN